MDYSLFLSKDKKKKENDMTDAMPHTESHQRISINDVFNGLCNKFGVNFHLCATINAHNGIFYLINAKYKNIKRLMFFS